MAPGRGNRLVLGKAAPRPTRRLDFPLLRFAPIQRTQEAYDHLLPVAEKFPKLWTVPYNLACYCTQLGKLEESKKWFQQAITINEKVVQRAAIDDPDLQPLRNSLSGTDWKRE